MKVTTQIDVTNDMEEQKEDLWKADEIEFPDYGVENWQNLRDMYQAKGGEKIAELLTGYPRQEQDDIVDIVDFCFMQDYKERLYIIPVSQRDQFKKTIADLDSIRQDLEEGYEPKIADAFFNGKEEGAFEKVKAHLDQKWGPYRVQGDTFDFSFCLPETIKDK